MALLEWISLLLPQAILDQLNEGKLATITSLERGIADYENVETELSCRRDVFEIMRVSAVRS